MLSAHSGGTTTQRRMRMFSLDFGTWLNSTWITHLVYMKPLPRITLIWSLRWLLTCGWRPGRSGFQRSCTCAAAVVSGQWRPHCTLTAVTDVLLVTRSCLRCLRDFISRRAPPVPSPLMSTYMKTFLSWVLHDSLGPSSCISVFGFVFSLLSEYLLSCWLPVLHQAFNLLSFLQFSSSLPKPVLSGSHGSLLASLLPSPFSSPDLCV